MDEKALIAAARDGDRAAFGELYRRFAPTVHGVLLARVAPDFVNDLLQDAFLKAMLAIQNLHDSDHFGAWLCAIARNCTRDFYRDRREQQPHDGMIDQIAAPERVTSNLDARRILAALQTLPDAYRETLALRLVEGLTGPEIAERTGLLHGSVRVNLHRGMHLLREALRASIANAKRERSEEQRQSL